MKTPLSYIVGYSALLTNADYDWSKKEIQSFGNEIYTKGKNIEDLISDLRQSFHTEHTGIPLSKETFDLVPFLQTLIADIANMPGAENYELNFAASADALLIIGDKKLLRRAFQNLLINAVCHNPAHTQISVKIDDPQDGIIGIEFCDNGTGISETIIEKVCSNEIKSNQVHGLDIVKSIIAAHHGKISVEAGDNSGSLFRIYLPIR